MVLVKIEDIERVEVGELLKHSIAYQPYTQGIVSVVVIEKCPNLARLVCLITFDNGRLGFINYNCSEVDKYDS